VRVALVSTDASLRHFRTFAPKKRKQSGLVPATIPYEQISIYEAVAVAASPHSGQKLGSDFEGETRVPYRLSRLPSFRGKALGVSMRV
jgi:hypothetical protein